MQDGGALCRARLQAGLGTNMVVRGELGGAGLGGGRGPWSKGWAGRALLGLCR